MATAAPRPERDAHGGAAPASDRGALQELLLALVGAVEAGRESVDDLLARIRGGGARDTLTELAHELGLVTREELEDVQLRLAQVEHRLRLLERNPS